MSAGAALQHRLQLQTAAQLSKFQKFMWWNIIFLQNMQFNIFLKCPLLCLSVHHSSLWWCIRIASAISCNVTADRTAQLNATPESTQFHNIIILDPQHGIASVGWCKVNVDCFLLRTHLWSSKYIHFRKKMHNKSAKLQNIGFGITFIFMCSGTTHHWEWACSHVVW